MRKKLSLSTAILFLISPILFAKHQFITEAGPSTLRRAQPRLNPASNQAGPYDSSPEHPWNRLFRAFYVREGRDGQEYGQDELDPLLWGETNYLLSGPSHQNAIKLLDEFIGANAALSIKDPLKRAMLQHDLWAVFDWASRYSIHYPRERRELQAKLAQVIRQLALKPEQIQALPDLYASAVAAKAFAAQYNSEQPETAFLPFDLFQPNGPWVCLAARGGGPAALTHTATFAGRSMFLVFMRLPEGRAATIEYLKKISDFPQLWIPSERFSDSLRLNPAAPQFPVGTQLALVRRINLIDEEGNLTPTRLIEQVQIRVHRRISNLITEGFNPQTTEEQTSQRFFEFKLSRNRLLRADTISLRNVVGDEKEFAFLMSHGNDPFESPYGPGTGPPARKKILTSCISCHFRPGVHSIGSLSIPNARLYPATIEYEEKASTYWKQTRFDWGFLQGFWRSHDLRPPQ